MNESGLLFPSNGFTEGSKGPAVLFVQQLLYSQGFTNDGALIPDGDYGPNTTVCLRAYQEDNGLSVTGHFDEDTMADMEGVFNFQMDIIPAPPGAVATYVDIPT